jgi:hypothetical protein
MKILALFLKESPVANVLVMGGIVLNDIHIFLSMHPYRVIRDKKLAWFVKAKQGCQRLRLAGVIAGVPNPMILVDCFTSNHL